MAELEPFAVVSAFFIKAHNLRIFRVFARKGKNEIPMADHKRCLGIIRACIQFGKGIDAPRNIIIAFIMPRPPFLAAFALILNAREINQWPFFLELRERRSDIAGE